MSYSKPNNRGMHYVFQNGNGVAFIPNKNNITEYGFPSLRRPCECTPLAIALVDQLISSLEEKGTDAITHSDLADIAELEKSLKALIKHKRKWKNVSSIRRRK